MTEKEHLERIAMMCREIGNDLKHIKRLARDLHDIYGIQLCDVGIQAKEHVQVYSGIDLIERALQKCEDEIKVHRIDGRYHKKFFYEQDVVFSQLSEPGGKVYLEANRYGDAVIDLRKMRDEHGNLY